MAPLRVVRAERLLSIRELARRAGVSTTTIYLTESGRTRPRPKVVRRLASALGVEPQEIDEFRRTIEAAKLPAPVGRSPRQPPAELAQPRAADGRTTLS